MPALGGVEMLIGIGLMYAPVLRLVVPIMLGHLVGTFLVLIVQPDIAFQDGNLFNLTTEGEFVIKNLVLIAGGLVVGSTLLEPAGARTQAGLPDVEPAGVADRYRVAPGRSHWPSWSIPVAAGLATLVVTGVGIASNLTLHTEARPTDVAASVAEPSVNEGNLLANPANALTASTVATTAPSITSLAPSPTSVAPSAELRTPDAERQPPATDEPTGQQPETQPSADQPVGTVPADPIATTTPEPAIIVSLAEPPTSSVPVEPSSGGSPSSPSTTSAASEELLPPEVRALEGIVIQEVALDGSRCGELHSTVDIKVAMADPDRKVASLTLQWSIGADRQGSQTLFGKWSGDEFRASTKLSFPSDTLIGEDFGEVQIVFEPLDDAGNVMASVSPDEDPVPLIVTLVDCFGA